MQHDSDKAYLDEFKDLAELLTNEYMKAEDLGTQIAADAQSSAQNIQRIDKQLTEIRELRGNLDAKISEAIKGVNRINAEHRASLNERRELKRIDSEVRKTLERLELYHTEDAGFVIPGVEDLPNQIAKLKQQCEDQQSSIDRVHERLDEISREDSVQDNLLELQARLSSMSVEFDEKLDQLTRQIGETNRAVTQIKSNASTHTSLLDKVNSNDASELESVTNSKQQSSITLAKRPANLKGGMYGHAVADELSLTSDELLAIFKRLKIEKHLEQQISRVDAQLIQDHLADDNAESASVRGKIPVYQTGITKRDVADATGLRVKDVKECARKSGFGTTADNAPISVNQYEQLARRIEIDHRIKRSQSVSEPEPTLASLALGSSSSSETPISPPNSLDTILASVDSELANKAATSNAWTADGRTDVSVNETQVDSPVDENTEAEKQSQTDKTHDGEISVTPNSELSGPVGQDAKTPGSAHTEDDTKTPEQLDEFVDRMIQKARALKDAGEFIEAIDVLDAVYDSTEQIGPVEPRIEILRLIIACLAQSDAECDGPIQAYEFFQSEIDQFADSTGQIDLLLDMARILRQVGDFDKCIDVLKQAVYAQERLNHGPIMAPVHELCEVLLDADQPAAANKVASKASERILETAGEVDPEYGPTEIGNAFGFQVKSHLAQGHFEAALAIADAVKSDSRFSDADRSAIDERISIVQGEVGESVSSDQSSEKENTEKFQSTSQKLETPNEEIKSTSGEPTNATRHDDTDDQTEQSEDAYIKQQDDVALETHQSDDAAKLIDEQAVLLVDDFDTNDSAADDEIAAEADSPKDYAEETERSTLDVERSEFGSQKLAEVSDENSTDSESIDSTTEGCDPIELIQTDNEDSSRVGVENSEAAFDGNAAVDELEEAALATAEADDVAVIAESPTGIERLDSADAETSSELAEPAVENSATNETASDQDDEQPIESRGLFSRIFGRKK